MAPAHLIGRQCNKATILVTIQRDAGTSCFFSLRVPLTLKPARLKVMPEPKLPEQDISNILEERLAEIQSERATECLQVSTESRVSDLQSGIRVDLLVKLWSGREGLNLRPPAPKAENQKALAAHNLLILFNFNELQK